MLNGGSTGAGWRLIGRGYQNHRAFRHGPLLLSALQMAPLHGYAPVGLDGRLCGRVLKVHNWHISEIPPAALDGRYSLHSRPWQSNTYAHRLHCDRHFDVGMRGVADELKILRPVLEYRGRLALDHQFRKGPQLAP